ncbi:SSI family serine proteinase inhibitor [Streptomyces sp. NPDC021093]|uniref:SSI family serine proteinase inhibitor n=1 Tax=Streptomyces sp. NPDC021093 TaxID=3365112 RepID=UPI0037AE5E09
MVFRAVLPAVAALALLPFLAGSATAAAASPKPEGKLTITVHEGEDSRGAVIGSADLNCYPTSGSHPRPHLTCRKVAAVEGDLRNLTPVERPCPMIYRPVTVVAHGTWKGTPTGFARTYPNQCVANAESDNVFNLMPWRR